MTETYHPSALVLGGLHWLLSGLAVLMTSKLVSNFRVSGFGSAILASLVIGFCNAAIWPVLFFLTLPVTILTFGLFTFVVNGAVIKIAAALLPGFEVRSWGAAIWGSLILSILGAGLHFIFV